jgi:hypothetical protein
MASKLFEWNKTSTDDYFDHYEVSIDGGATWIDNGINTSYDWTDIITLGTKTFQVRGVNTRGEYSNILEWTFELIEALTLNKVSMTDDTYPWNKIFTWELLTGVIDHYEVEKDGDGNWINVGTDVTYTWNDVSEDSHIFKVKGIDVLGNDVTLQWDFIVSVNDMQLEKITPDFDYLIV